MQIVWKVPSDLCIMESCEVDRRCRMKEMEDENSIVKITSGKCNDT